MSALPTFADAFEISSSDLISLSLNSLPRLKSVEGRQLLLSHHNKNGAAIAMSAENHAKMSRIRGSGIQPLS